MVNPEIINERLREMEENLILLEELKSTPAGKFRDDPKIFKLAERCLEVSIQALLDICHHIIADNRWPKPKDNQEAIEIFARHKIIPPHFARTILPMAGLRNLLVHEYAKIDPAVILNTVRILPIFVLFKNTLSNF